MKTQPAARRGGGAKVTMRRAILFRYHDYLAVCANRVALLRHFNPDLPIWGMYGGADTISPRDIGLDADYTLPFPDPRFKWEHGDLCIRQWFIDQGHAFDFDMIHVVEWDLVMMDSLDHLFGHITDGVAVSNKLLLSQLCDEGWGWITNPKRAAEFNELCTLIAMRHGLRLTPETIYAGSFGTAALSRAFLERYAMEPNLSPLTHDEIRMTAFATAYGMPVHDTNVTKGNSFWNCEKAYFGLKEIEKAPNGHKVFHPVKEILETPDM